METKILIENAITSLTNNSSIEHIMLQVQKIAYLLKDENFKEWVDCELNGYKDRKVPPYRTISCQVICDVGTFGGIMQNQIFPIGLIGAQYDEYLFHLSFRESISEIEKISQQKGLLSGNVEAPMYALMNKYIDGNLISAKKIISTINVSSIVTTVKSKLLDFFLQLNENSTMNIDLTKMEYPKEVTTIMNQTINAGIVSTGAGNIKTLGSNIIGGKDNTVSIGDDLRSKLLSLIEEIKKIDIKDCNDKQDIEDSIVDIEEGLQQKKPHSFFRRILRYLKTIPSIVATHSLELSIDKVISLLS